MNSKFYVILCLAVTMLACNKDSSEVAPTHQNNYKAAHTAAKDPDPAANSLFISTDDANQMIGSYLSSISSPSTGVDGTGNVKSFSIDADSLRAYLSDPKVKNVKLMLAHTKDYIDAGNTGKYAGYQSGALTIVVAAYDEDGNYIYHNGSYVLDHCMPCPSSCPVGAAGSDLLQ